MTGHVFLVGFMGAGKSTVAALLAQELELPRIDLDQQIERTQGRSVSAIFSEMGEEAFREMESQALDSLTDEPPSVVACGGGIVVRQHNREKLARLGTVVYLQVTAGEAIARVGDAGTRPLLSGSGATLAATSLLQARESLYRSVADFTVDTVGSSPDMIVQSVLAAIAGGEAR